MHAQCAFAVPYNATSLRVALIAILLIVGVVAGLVVLIVLAGALAACSRAAAADETKRARWIGSHFT